MQLFGEYFICLCDWLWKYWFLCCENRLQMPLATLHKTFGLDLLMYFKEDFPNLFNCLENQSFRKSQETRSKLDSHLFV